MRGLAFSVCAGICALLILPLTAQAQNGTGILMGQDMVLRAGPPRQLSLNANISQFLYQPTGDDIAYVSVTDDGSSETSAIKYVGTHRNNAETQTVFSVTGDAPNATVHTAVTYLVDLIGWSGNGRYLLFKEETFPGFGTHFLLADTGADPFQVKVRPIAPLPIPANFMGLSGGAWSPGQDRLLVFKKNFGQILTTYAEVYDPVTEQSQSLSIPDGNSLQGWLDETHLLLRQDGQPAKNPGYASYDLAANKVTLIPQTPPWPPVPQAKLLFGVSVATTTPKVPGLTLGADRQAVSDPQGAARAPVWTVWLRRAAAPKAMSDLSVGIAPGSRDPQWQGTDSSAPQPQWSPNGDAVAYLSHGDLFVVPLEETEATPFEKVVAGEKIPCDEEKQIIMSNLKKVGLGLLEYTQDHDESYPPDAGWQEAIGPYLQDQNPLNFPGVPIAYHAPDHLSLASIASPATEPLATADTPCAHIVLFADGHVKAFDKAGR